MTKHLFLKPAFARVPVVIMIVLCALTATAQSGRRAPHPAPAATPTPEATPAPNPTPVKKSSISLLVGIDKSDTFANIPLNFYDTVLGGCYHRLKGSSAQVDIVEQSFNRSEAVKKAKGEKETFVVLLRLIYDSMGGSSSANYDQLIVDYLVFAPTTGKIATSGRSYPGTNRKGPIVLPRTSGGNMVYTERLLNRAAEEAADRILDGLHVVELPRGLP